MSELRARSERFGAIVALDEPPALVSVNRVLAQRLGVSSDGLWEDSDPGLALAMLRAPTEVHVAATSRCPAGCKSCYADATPKGHEPTSEEVRARIKELADARVFSIAFGGGEAALRSDISQLAAYARELGLNPTMTTSGLGMTRERAESFRVFSQINVSYDGAVDVSTSVRGYDGATVATHAMQCLKDAGVPFGVNTVLTRTSFPRIAETADAVAALGAVELQLLRFKPSGRGKMNYLAERLTPDQIQVFPTVLRALSSAHPFAIRIDCALMPFLVHDDSIAPARIAEFGVMGCEAGRSLCAIRSDGDIAPCSFWQTDGGSSAENLVAAWREDSTLGKFRSYAAEAPEPCRSCTYRAVCRSGCRIVAQELTGNPYAPDPECPRVRSMR